MLTSTRAPDPTSMGSPSVLVRGGIAGLLGGTALALWFLVVDSSLGDPFRVLALLANSLFGVEGLGASPGLIVLYTVIHYAAFVAVGIAATSLGTLVDWAPSTLLGFALGFILFDILVVVSISVTGIDVIQELGWLEVLTGNVLAGLVMTSYLHVTGAVQPLPWWRVLADTAIVREGAVAGLLAACTIALWFLVIDLIQGRPFFTPAALGSALFLGASSIAQVELTAWTVIGYSLLHLGSFGALGITASAIAGRVESMPPIVEGVVLLVVVFEAFSFGFFSIIAEFVLASLSFWSVGAGNLLGVIVMSYYLWRRHPEIKRAIADDAYPGRAFGSVAGSALGRGPTLRPLGTSSGSPSDGNRPAPAHRSRSRSKRLPEGWSLSLGGRAL